MGDTNNFTIVVTQLPNGKISNITVVNDTKATQTMYSVSTGTWDNGTPNVMAGDSIWIRVNVRNDGGSGGVRCVVNVGGTVVTDKTNTVSAGGITIMDSSKFTLNASASVTVSVTP
jgi:hypothetical protein